MHCSFVFAAAGCYSVLSNLIACCFACYRNFACTLLNYICFGLLLVVSCQIPHGVVFRFCANFLGCFGVFCCVVFVSLAFFFVLFVFAVVAFSVVSIAEPFVFGQVCCCSVNCIAVAVLSLFQLRCFC